jgi:hypothetical protein
MFTSSRFLVAALAGSLCALATAGADDAPEKSSKPVDKGQRLFTAGHSLHHFITSPLQNVAQLAGIKEHTPVGYWPTGNYLQYWKEPDDKHKLKQALRDGKVDVLTLIAMDHRRPDKGIDEFTKFALEHNPNIRITVQAAWLNYDEVPAKGSPASVDRDARTIEELRKNHADYFKIVADHVRAVNKQHGKQVLFLVPVGQATLALREKIAANQAPGLKKQADLFRDTIGHAREPLQMLTVYCHFAVIYRRSPVGLPLPNLLKQAKNPDWDEKMDRMLQELAWETVIQEPLSGVKGAAADFKGR